jgi:hypothetical protein
MPLFNFRFSMDAATLNWAGSYLSSFPALPLLWVPHCLVMSMALRMTLGQRWKPLAQQHPLSCYVLGLIYTFPGGILSSVIMAEPPMAFLLNTPFVLAATVCWYIVFYAPGDIVAKVLSALRLRPLLFAAQDLLRLQLVLSGVMTIHKLHPGAFLYAVTLGIVKSSGFMFFKYIEYVVTNGVGKGLVIVPSSKACIVASVAFAAQTSGFLPFSIEAIFTVAVAMVWSMRLIDALTGAEHDFFSAIENGLCKALFGTSEKENKDALKKGN